MERSSITHLPSARLLQATYDAAVVVPTILRPTLPRAIQSVYEQKFPGRIQVLIGIDQASGDPAVLDRLRLDCPAHCVLTVLDLGYSTAERHGGLYPGGCGGALRTILSYAANSVAVAYLDDDNWFGEDHLRTLRDALEGHDYAFSSRWFVDQATGRPLCIDDWESVGPDAGVFREQFGGFIDPNCLMIDKVKCDAALRLWCYPMPGDGRAMSEDRTVFRQLREHHKGRGTGVATAYYVMQPEDGLHSNRLRIIAQKSNGRVPAPGQA